MPNTHNLTFFLGGHDLEMLTIKELLDEKGELYYDAGLSWGAKASDYKNEIEETLRSGHTPVLVELIDDMGISKQKGIIIDHHGEKAGADRPTSLHQVFGLLRLPREKWSRWFELVAANDRGYIPEMLKIGAAKSEILKIRLADRKAQGITDEQEKQGAQAVKRADILFDGKLTIVHLPHSKTAVVADLLYPALADRQHENLLVISPNEVNFFGDGNIIFELNTKFPGGWYGGALPDYGFWGHSSPASDVVEFLKKRVSDSTQAQVTSAESHLYSR